MTFSLEEITGLIEQAQHWINNDCLPLTGEFTRKLVDALEQLSHENENILAASQMEKAETIEECAQVAYDHTTFIPGLPSHDENNIRVSECMEIAKAIRALNPPSLAETTSAPSFTCPRCGLTSYNPNDVAYRYCGKCHRFFDESARSKRT